MTNDRQKRTSIILAMVALAIAAITICAVMFSMSSGQTKDPSSGVVLDKNAVAFDTGDTLSADPLRIRFPGYNDITLSQSDRDIPIVLTNPTGNPCLFQFDVTYTMNLENDTAFVPKGKKVSVTIDSAGYPGTLNKFAVWDSKNLEEASYEIYYSDRMAGHRYSIGDEIVSWDGSNHGTQTRRIAVLDYNHVQPGNYSGVINYGISLKDK